MKFTNEQIEQGLDKIFDNLLQTKDVEASESMEITPDEGYAGIKKVNLTVKGGGGGGLELTFLNFNKVFRILTDEQLALDIMSGAVLFRGNFENNGSIQYKYAGPAGAMYIESMYGNSPDGTTGNPIIAVFLDRPSLISEDAVLTPQPTLREKLLGGGITEEKLNSVIIDMTLEQFFDPNFSIS